MHDIKEACREIIDQVKEAQRLGTATESDFRIGSLAALTQELADRVANLEAAVRMNGVDVPREKRHPLQD